MLSVSNFRNDSQPRLPFGASFSIASPTRFATKSAIRASLAFLAPSDSVSVSWPTERPLRNTARQRRRAEIRTSVTVKIIQLVHCRKTGHYTHHLSPDNGPQTGFGGVM